MLAGLIRICFVGLNMTQLVMADLPCDRFIELRGLMVWKRRLLGFPGVRG